MPGMRSSSEEVHQLERNAAVPDTEDELDMLQRSSWLGKPMVQSPKANKEPIPALTKKQPYILHTKNHEPD